MKNEIVVINGIRAYESEDRVAYLGLEEVVRELGFTETRWNNTLKQDCKYVKWERVFKYLKEFGIESKDKQQFIPENVFYKLCMKANNEVARKFQDLVCDEILPQIRQTGGYIQSTEEDTDEEIMARALLVAQKTIEKKNLKIKNLENKIVEQQPKVEYHDNVLKSDKLLTTTQIAKDLGISAIKLNAKLKEMGIIYKKSDTWFFYAKYENRIPEYADYVIGETYQHLKWTEKGRQWIIELLGDNK